MGLLGIYDGNTLIVYMLILLHTLYLSSPIDIDMSHNDLTRSKFNILVHIVCHNDNIYLCM